MLAELLDFFSKKNEKISFIPVIEDCLPVDSKTDLLMISQTKKTFDNRYSVYLNENEITQIDIKNLKKDLNEDIQEFFEKFNRNYNQNKKNSFESFYLNYLSVNKNDFNVLLDGVLAFISKRAKRYSLSNKYYQNKIQVLNPWLNHISSNELPHVLNYFFSFSKLNIKNIYHLNNQLIIDLSDKQDCNLLLKKIIISNEIKEVKFKKKLAIIPFDFSERIGFVMLEKLIFQLFVVIDSNQVESYAENNILIKPLYQTLYFMMFILPKIFKKKSCFSNNNVHHWMNAVLDKLMFEIIEESIPVMSFLNYSAEDEAVSLVQIKNEVVKKYELPQINDLELNIMNMRLFYNFFPKIFVLYYFFHNNYISVNESLFNDVHHFEKLKNLSTLGQIDFEIFYKKIFEEFN